LRIRLRLSLLDLAFARKPKTAHSLLWFAAIKYLERVKDSASLAPQGGFITAETIEREIGQVGQSQKAASELDIGSVDVFPRVGYRFHITYSTVRNCVRALINLVGNAIKFTDAGEVAIKAEAHNGSFHVSVRDTGPGISSADQARLFQEFQQADNAITKKKGGTGLGLAISKRIIEMHGGRISVESQPGQGSTFTFTLPVIVERQVEAG